MLKHLKFLILLVLPFSFAMALTSCSDDDNDVSDEESSLLVGSWERSGDWGFEVLTFNADGTFTEYGNELGYSYSDTGKYSYDPSAGIILFSGYDAETGEYGTEKYKVLSISSLELVVEESDAGDHSRILTYNRKIQ